MMIPFVVYEKRLDVNTTKTNDNVQQFLAGLIYIAPGKTLFGITATYVASGNDISRYGTGSIYGGTTGSALNKTGLFSADLYIDHKIKINDGMSIKPIFEIVWATGGVTPSDSAALFGTHGMYVKTDVLNLILKAEIEMKGLVKITPEFIFQKAPAKGTAKESYMNFWGSNEFCGSEYTVGNIFNGYKGGFSFGNGAETPSTLVVKLPIDILVLDNAVKGLSAYVWIIYGMPLGKAKTTAYFTGTVTEVDKSDKQTIMELSFGMAYSIDANTTVGFDAAWAKTGDFTAGGSIATFTSKTTYTYLGADLTIKF